MVFNGDLNSLDLVSDIKYWCGIDSSDTTSYPLKDMARNANFALDRVTALIMRSDATWKWDDTNNSDTPIATANLTADTEAYSLAVTYLKIIQVRIKDQQGNWVTLQPKQRRELTDDELTAAAGDPVQYFKIGNKLYLNPKPSYSSSNGLEYQVERGASYFAYNDTTKTPGFATQFHRLISLYASLDYCEANGLDSRANIIRSKITPMEQELMEYYSSRANDETPAITLKKTDYGEISLGQDTQYSNNPDGFRF